MYRLVISAAAHRQIRRLLPTLQARIDEAIARLTEDPRPPGSLKLTGREGHRIRVGDYRVLYRIDDDQRQVLVFRVMARDEVYKAR